MEPSACLGHQQRKEREHKIKMLASCQPQKVSEHLRVSIKKGPVSVETSLSQLEEIYENKSEWKLIAEGGVLTVPVEEFRMINLPSPDRKGNVAFAEKKGKGAATQIENYPVAQTVKSLNQQILEKYNREKEKGEVAGMSKASSETAAQAMAKKLPEFTAVQKWLDNEAEIRLKRALGEMMKKLKIPSLIIRSISLKAISALKDLGLKLHGDAEIDLVMAYVSGDFLRVVIFEVKRSDTYPWQKQCPLPNKQAVSKAEVQLSKDVEVLMAIMAGTPPGQIIIQTLAAFPDASSTELQAVFCPSCLEDRIVVQEDLADLSLLQKKTRVPDKPDPATLSGTRNLLTLSARCLSHQSLLHVGFREVEDKEKLVTERHRYNLEAVDGRIMRKEFVIASSEQQQVIASFTSSSTAKHLVLEGPAGTGKTLVALQVANNLLESAKDTSEGAGMEPLLIVTTPEHEGDSHIMKYLDSTLGRKRENKKCMNWRDIRLECGISGSKKDAHLQLLHVAEGIAKKWEGRQIILLVDEILNKEMLSQLKEQCFPESLRMILILNPKESYRNLLTLPPAIPEDVLGSKVLRVTLTVPYRSTIAITSLARFIAKCRDLEVPQADFGSDVQGPKPIFFDIGKDETKMEQALEYCREHLGDDVTILHDNVPSKMLKFPLKLGKAEGGPWDCFFAFKYYGWETEKVVAVCTGQFIMESITRAKTHLVVLLVDGGFSSYRNHYHHYEETKGFLTQAADLGLVEIVKPNSSKDATEDVLDLGCPV